MIGITGAVTAIPTREPRTSIARFAMRTLRNMPLRRYHVGAATCYPGPDMGAPSIRLTVPGTLRHRAIAVRVVAEACRLVSRPPEGGGAGDGRSDNGAHVSPGYDLSHPFDAAFVSAFAEIFNNIAIHAYQRRDG